MKNLVAFILIIGFWLFWLALYISVLGCVCAGVLWVVYLIFHNVFGFF